MTAKYCKVLASAKIVAEHPDHPTNLFNFCTLDSACSASWARMLWRSARIRPRSRATETATRREFPAVKTDRVAQSLTTHHTLVKFGSANISIGMVLSTHQGIQWRLFAKRALGRIGSTGPMRSCTTNKERCLRQCGPTAVSDRHACSLLSSIHKPAAPNS